MKEGSSNLTKWPLDLAGECEGQRVYARAIGPYQIELCTARSMPEAEQGQEEAQAMENFRVLELA